MFEYAVTSDRDVVNMVSGSPDWDSPTSLSRGLHNYADEGGSAYPPTTGLTRLREEIANRRGVNRDQIIVTAGACEANHILTAYALDAFGSKVAFLDPVYPYYPGRVDLLGGDPVTIPAGATGEIEPRAIRSPLDEEIGAILLNTPNNPTGAVYDHSTLEEIIHAAEEQGALVICDEAYDHLDLSGTFTSSLAIDSPHRAMVGSFSKTLAATGYRVGYLIAQPDIVDDVKQYKTLTSIATSRPAQAAVHHALEEVSPEYFQAVRERLLDRREIFCNALSKMGAEHIVPDGGFYVLAKIPEYSGSINDAKRLIDERGVAAMPGEAFGDTISEWLRFTLVTDRVEEAANRLDPGR
ncbi:MAG: pyridoxal phosphate-dependent aminotransferase [Halobacteriaceae archaeon]